MNARLIKAWNDLQSSYYFIPGVMVTGAMVLAWVTGHLDRRYDYELAERIGWFYSNKADGARTILSTIAGSMMTVASVTFSITMVAVTSAAGQYGPRLIGNFMRDRGNQVTLGTFTSTFVYCLLILRSARTGDGGTGENAVAEFVPNLSLLVAMGLTLASVAVLIYFIHHIPETLNVGNITGRLGRRLRRDLEAAFHPEAQPVNNQDLHAFDEIKSDNVTSHAEGFVQAVNTDALLTFATKNECIIKLSAMPGDFVTANQVLAQVCLTSEEELDQSLHKKARSAFAMGQERTPHQNVLFLSDQLVEILIRALSPGINDPFTAINCIHWFQSGLQAAMRGHTPTPYKYDDAGNIRLIIRRLEFEDLIDSICNQIRPYVARDTNVTIEMVKMLFNLLECTNTLAEKKIIRRHIQALSQAAGESLPASLDRDAIQKLIQSYAR